MHSVPRFHRSCHGAYKYKYKYKYKLKQDTNILSWCLPNWIALVATCNLLQYNWVSDSKQLQINAKHFELSYCTAGQSERWNWRQFLWSVHMSQLNLTLFSKVGWYITNLAPTGLVSHDYPEWTLFKWHFFVDVPLLRVEKMGRLKRWHDYDISPT